MQTLYRQTFTPVKRWYKVYDVGAMPMAFASTLPQGAFWYKIMSLTITATELPAFLSDLHRLFNYTPKGPFSLMPFTESPGPPMVLFYILGLLQLYLTCRPFKGSTKRWNHPICGEIIGDFLLGPLSGVGTDFFYIFEDEIGRAHV